MKNMIHYLPTGRLARRGDQRSKQQDQHVNESSEKDARVREGVGMKAHKVEHPAMFASYGNGPFLMPSLQFPG